MSNILKIKQFPEVEKCRVIQHLKNEIRIIGDEFKTNNIDLLIHVMNFVEMYFTGHKMGKMKEEVQKLKKQVLRTKENKEKGKVNQQVFDIFLNKNIKC